MNESKCREALNNLKNVIITRHYDKELTKEYIEVLEDLITEHFDNPPLKFEELRKNMWVWDDVKKNYDQMKCITIINSEKRPYKYIDFERNGVIEFKEGRFYRKQVNGDVD